MQWISKIWKPYADSKAPKRLILMLDSYAVHVMAEVISELQKLRTTVLHIPAGCTGRVQVLDVGVNKPFKVYVTRESTKWRIKPENIGKKVGREEMCSFIGSSWGQIRQDTILSTFRHCGFTCGEDGDDIVEGEDQQEVQEDFDSDEEYESAVSDDEILEEELSSDDE